jgi:glycine cleavage system H protein
LPEIGVQFNKGDAIVNIIYVIINNYKVGIESVKTAADVYTPVQGSITEAN